MMKAIKSIFFVAFFATLSVVFLSCNTSKDVRGKDETFSKTCQIGYFSKVDITSFADVRFVQGKDVSMRIVGKKSLVDRVEYGLDGETLVIKHKPNNMRKGNFLFGDDGDDLTIYISSPDLTGVTLVGSGSFIMDGNLDTDAITAELRGSGDIVFKDVVCDNFVGNLRGSGDFNAQNINGRSVNLALFGSGDMSVKHVVAQTSDVSLRGSGDLAVALNKVDKSSVGLFGSGDMVVDFADCGHADCQLRGSGDIVLHGSLRSVSKSTTGSGDIDDHKLVVNAASGRHNVMVK